MTKLSLAYDATGTDRIKIERINDNTGCLISVSFRIFNWGNVSSFTDDHLIEKAKEIFSINKSHIDL